MTPILSEPSGFSDTNDKTTPARSNQNKVKQRVDQLHHRKWSLESDLRISRDVNSTRPSRWLPTAPSISSAPRSPLQAWESAHDGTIDSHASPWSISQEDTSTTLMPSWPSSVLCKEEEESPPYVLHSARAATPATIDESGTASATMKAAINKAIECGSPKSFVSDKATENSYSPYQSESCSTFLSPNNSSNGGGAATRAQSPLLIRQAVQVDEFGRIILTVKGKDRVVKFRDTTNNIMSTPAMSTVSDSSLDTDTLNTPTSSIKGQRYTTLPSNESAQGDKEEVKSASDAAILRFPALCEAISAKSPRRLSSFMRESFDPNIALLSPIELASEKKKETEDNIIQESALGTRKFHQSPRMTTSYSESKIQQYLPKKPLLGRPRAESDTGDFAKILRNENQIKTLPSPLPWPIPPLQGAKSIKRVEPHSGPTTSTFKDNTTCPSTTFSSSQESSTSVQSIIEQQRLAMQKLTQAGFWKSKPVKKVREEKPSDARFRLPAVPEEDYVSKVSLWAWLVSSDGCIEDDLNEEVLPSSSPFPDEEAEEDIETGRFPSYPPKIVIKEEEEAAGKSWEWLSNDDAFARESFETCETFDHLEIGLNENCPLESLIIDNGDPDTSQTSTQNETSIDSGKNQRESMTTAAIEALLTQVQQSQESDSSKPSTVRKTGASYLYQQILNKINEEDSVDHE